MTDYIAPVPITHSTIAGNVPDSEPEAARGALSLNITDAALYTKDYLGNIVRIEGDTGNGTLASASTLALGAVMAAVIDITGTTTVTAITLRNGQTRTVRFTDSLTLTHGTELVLPDALNMKTLAGDFAIFRGFSGSVVRCIAYLPAKRNTNSTLASAATLDLTTVAGDAVDVTGTTTVTAITLREGVSKTLRFTDALTLTNGASLVLPGAANITTAAGDFAEVRGYASGVVRCVGYTFAAGSSAALAATVHAATSKTTPVDADEMPLVDSFASFGLKKFTWANLKATLAAWINGNLIPASFTSVTVDTTLLVNATGAAEGSYSFSAMPQHGIFVAANAGFNGADTAEKIGRNSVTLRSINAGGTVNASGTDYAEYEHNNGLTIAKGDVVGFKSDGTLTQTFSEAVRFGIKSTNPSYVGGDTWGSEEVLGVAKPEFQSDKFDKIIETARRQVDRIAYSGKVPVNITNAIPGGYIIASDNAGLIAGKFLTDPDFDQYKKAVGRVNRILCDGRAEVAVIIH